MNSRFELVEERISELAKRLIEIYGREREKKMKKHENSLREISVTIKRTTIHIIGVPDEGGREKAEKVCLHNG